jgi:hypothetical protein
MSITHDAEYRFDFMDYIILPVPATFSSRVIGNSLCISVNRVMVMHRLFTTLLPAVPTDPGKA